MKHPIQLPFYTLLLMISFASINAVLFTPALPDIAHYFHISVQHAELTVLWFLIAYTIGQLIYGPIANRYGRKPALYLGISIQILSSLLCVAAGYLHEYLLLIMGRFFLALGAGVGLKMTFTLVNECYEPHIASQKTAYLMLAFAITPALSVALGGILNSHFGWISCFYAGALYGVMLLFLVSRLPETHTDLHHHAFQLKHLAAGYSTQFKNRALLSGACLMGSATAFVYIFAALAPFIAINLGGMNSTQYGLSNLIPSVGLIAGSLLSASLSKKYSFQAMISRGIFITIIGVAVMFATTWAKLSPLYSLFLPMCFMYVGLSFVVINASAFAMSQTADKAHGSAVMNFINMGIATIGVLSLNLFHVSQILLPIVYVVLCAVMSIALSFHLPLKTRELQREPTGN